MPKILAPALVVLCMISAHGARADATVREQHDLSVGGVRETWQLVWEAPPRTACGPEDIPTAFSCPCAGTAYGESGKLDLVRLRGTKEVERLDLSPLFGQFDGPPGVDGMSSLIRWPMLDGDLVRASEGDPTLRPEIMRRPALVIMRFADYDGDGEETEFLLPIGSLACGKVQYAAVGLSSQNPRLHAFGSAAHPEAMLAMPLPAWHALLLRTGASTVPLWACGDHGSEERRELVVSAGTEGIHAHERDFSCPEDGSPEKLLRESDW
jgi:hypothetical protein